MKAILLEETGWIEKLITQNIETPTPNSGEVLIETKSLSINPVDYKAREIETLLSMLCGEERPVILGWDIAGVVSAVWEDVTEFVLWDKVFGMVNFPGSGKTYAEYVISPANQLAKIPENTSFEQASATTLAALTALQALENNVKQWDRVFIHAGAGWVGHYAIQLAKHMGAHVTTTASAKNRDFVLWLGADEHIDYRVQEFEDVVSNMDFLLDTMWGDILKKSLKVMKNGGKIISLPDNDSVQAVKEDAEKNNIDVSWLLVKSSGEDMLKLAKLLENNDLKATIANTFSFEEIGKAHSDVETGRTVGKIIVNI